MKLTRRTRLIIALACFLLATLGFMLKLPVGFRKIDKELHAAFYFSAALFLHLLFLVKDIARHFIIILVLVIFCLAIEQAQEYSNRWVGRRIHGRFDIEDVWANLKGLLLFSVLWLLWFTGCFFWRRRKHHA
jgi:hypothetical protein